MSTKEPKDAAVAAATGTAEDVPDMSLLSITNGENERGIPIVKFLDNMGAFAESFTLQALAELLIGAYTKLHSKLKAYDISLTQKWSYLFVSVCMCHCLLDIIFKCALIF
jgi:hypothetical protein